MCVYWIVCYTIRYGMCACVWYVVRYDSKRSAKREALRIALPTVPTRCSGDNINVTNTLCDGIDRRSCAKHAERIAFTVWIRRCFDNINVSNKVNYKIIKKFLQ